MSLVIPNTFTAGTAITAADVNENFDEIASWAAGNIINANIDNNAAIAVSKLAGSKEHYPISVLVYSGQVNATVPIIVPFWHDGLGDWRASKISWYFSDPGTTDTNTIQAQYGYIKTADGVGAFTQSNNLGTVTVSRNSAASDVPAAGVTTPGTDLSSNGHLGMGCFAITIGALGAGSLTAATSFVAVTIQLSRAIST